MVNSLGTSGRRVGKVLDFPTQTKATHYCHLWGPRPRDQPVPHVQHVSFTPDSVQRRGTSRDRLSYQQAAAQEHRARKTPRAGHTRAHSQHTHPRSHACSHTPGHGASLGTHTLKASPDSPPKGVPPAPETGDPTPQSVPRLYRFWSNHSRDLSHIGPAAGALSPKEGESTSSTEPSPCLLGQLLFRTPAPVWRPPSRAPAPGEEETRDWPAATPGLSPTRSLPSDRPGSLRQPQPEEWGGGEVTATLGTGPLLDGETEARGSSGPPGAHAGTDGEWRAHKEVPTRASAQLPPPRGRRQATAPERTRVRSRLCTRPTAAHSSPQQPWRHRSESSFKWRTG